MSDQPVASAPSPNDGNAQAHQPDAPEGMPADEGLGEKKAAEADPRTRFRDSVLGAPNQASAHLGSQHAANAQLFGTSLNDLVLGDQSITQNFHAVSDRKPLIFRRLSAEAMDEATAFVESRDHSRFSAFAKGRHLVVLAGEPGCGRTALALRLLLHSCGAESVHALPVDTDFAALTSQPLPRGTGIIASDITDRAAATLDDFKLRQLTDTLASRDQVLIITSSTAQAWGTGAIATHTITVADRPDARVVLERHYRRRLGPGGHHRVRLLERPDVRALIEAHTGPDRPLSAAALLATLLADAAGDPDTMAPTAELGMASVGDADFEAWFQGLDAQSESIREHCYAIALAVLNELPNETVTEAGNLLERILSPETAEARDAQKPRPFGHSHRTKLLRVCAAQCLAIDPSAPFGPPRVVTRYIRREYPPRLLTHVWDEYDDQRAQLTRWIKVLGQHPVEEVRTRAGVAAGKLAMSSFDHVLNTIVLPWARSRQVIQQDSAAVALQTAGSDPRYAARVKATIEEWAGEKSSDPDDFDAFAQVTAARAYGGEFGAARLDDAIGSLARLAEVEQWPITLAVVRSLTELIAADVPEATARVLNLLREWSMTRKPILRSVGRFAFLYAAADLVDHVPVHGSGVSEVPSLLRFDANPQYCAVFRYLWTDALTSSDHYETARVVLTTWAKRLDTDPDRRSALVRMVTGLASTPRTQSLVRLLTRDWAGRDGAGPAPRTASLLSAVSFF